MNAVIYGNGLDAGGFRNRASDVGVGRRWSSVRFVGRFFGSGRRLWHQFGRSMASPEHRRQGWLSGVSNRIEKQC